MKTRSKALKSLKHQGCTTLATLSWLLLSPMAVVSGQPTNWATCITFHYELFINYVYLFIEFVRLPIHVISWIILACLHIFLFILASAVLALAMHVQCLCQRTASDIMYFHFDVIINHHIIIHYLELLQYYVHTYIYIYYMCVCACVHVFVTRC